MGRTPRAGRAFWRPARSVLWEPQDSPTAAKPGPTTGWAPTWSAAAGVLRAVRILRRPTPTSRISRAPNCGPNGASPDFRGLGEHLLSLAALRQHRRRGPGCRAGPSPAPVDVTTPRRSRRPQPRPRFPAHRLRRPSTSGRTARRGQAGGPAVDHGRRAEPRPLDSVGDGAQGTSVDRHRHAMGRHRAQPQGQRPGPGDGTATIELTPTDTEPRLTSTLAAPAGKPYLETPIDVDTQRVVSTGGEKQLTAQATVPAQRSPDRSTSRSRTARAAKDSGVALRLTAKDQISRPGAKWRAAREPGWNAGRAHHRGRGRRSGRRESSDTAGDLRHRGEPSGGPRRCFRSHRPAFGLRHSQPGATLALTIENIPNEVPTAIPADAGPPAAVVHAATSTTTSPLSIAALGTVALPGTALVGFLARRRFERN